MATTDNYNILLNNMFAADFNANDFFDINLAASVSIAREDFSWILEHIDKWSQDGLNACIAYIQNQPPLTTFENDNFNQALQDLIDRDQVVFGDVDYKFYYYNTQGTYRKIKQHDI